MATNLPKKVSVEVMWHINGEDPLSDWSWIDNLSSDALVNKHNLRKVKFDKKKSILQSFADDPSTYHTRSGEASLLHLRFLPVASASYDILRVLKILSMNKILESKVLTGEWVGESFGCNKHKRLQENVQRIWIVIWRMNDK